MKTIEEIDSLKPEDLNGMRVKCKGFCMLAKLNDGKKYRMENYYDKRFGDCVTFYSLMGKKPIVNHSAWSVIASIQGCSNGYLNGLEIA